MFVTFVFTIFEYISYGTINFRPCDRYTILGGIYQHYLIIFFFDFHLESRVYCVRNCSREIERLRNEMRLFCVDDFQKNKIMDCFVVVAEAEAAAAAAAAVVSVFR